MRREQKESTERAERRQRAKGNVKEGRGAKKAKRNLKRRREIAGEIGV